MEISVNIRDLSNTVLSLRASALVSEFALTLYRETGIYIDVDSDDILSDVVMHAKKNNSNALKTVYQQLRAELGYSILDSVSNGNIIPLRGATLQPA